MIQEQLKILEKKIKLHLESIKSSEHLEQFKIDYLGKKGTITSLMKQLKQVAPEMRSALGKAVNDLKQKCSKEIECIQKEIKARQYQNQIEKEWIDITLSKKDSFIGSLHPITQIQYRLEDIFTAMGFQVLDGPHIETEYYNFEALNIPKHHPARDMQDTFYFEDGHLLRTQTSDIQIRGMESLQPPFRIIGPGKVFRCERTDASHDSCFHQLEGMLVDRNISVSHLIYFMKIILSEIFETNVKVRLRPGYFPFVEPGFELEMACLLCQSKGCSVCKKIGWIELLGCGMVHPNVLKAGNVDPSCFSGFAFGIGMDRLAMMKYGIDDIRYLHGGNLKLMEQFVIV